MTSEIKNEMKRIGAKMVRERNDSAAGSTAMLSLVDMMMIDEVSRQLADDL